MFLSTERVAVFFRGCLKSGVAIKKRLGTPVSPTVDLMRSLLICCPLFWEQLRAHREETHAKSFSPPLSHEMLKKKSQISL